MDLLRSLRGWQAVRSWNETDPVMHAIAFLEMSPWLKDPWFHLEPFLQQATANFLAILVWWVLLQVIVESRLFVKDLILRGILVLNHEVIFKSF